MENTMDKTEMLDKYGDVPMQFSSYYKYSFTYIGVTADGKELMAFIGGDADGIYRTYVGIEPVMLRNLDARTVYLDGKDLWSADLW